MEDNWGNKARPGPTEISRRKALLYGGVAAASFSTVQAGDLLHTSAARAAVKWYYPFTATVQEGDGYGMRTHPIYGTQRMHNGIDYQPGSGASIYSVAAGTVTFAGANGGYGNFVRISHADGFTSAYAHMQEGSISVRVGQSIAAGILVGRVGSTGDSTGAHLHFEMTQAGNFIDPTSYMQNAPRNPGAPVSTEIPIDDRN